MHRSELRPAEIVFRPSCLTINLFFIVICGCDTYAYGETQRNTWQESVEAMNRIIRIEHA